MTGTDLIPLLPFLIIAATSVVITLAISFRRSHGITFLLFLTGTASSFFSTFFVLPEEPCPVTPLLLVDGFGLFYTALILASAFIVALLSYDYLRIHKENLEEYYLLLLLATLGSMVMTSTVHFASFFLGLEILSVSLYALIAYQRMDLRHIEGGVKYLILSAFASAFLLFGIALIYARTGTMEFAGVAEKLGTDDGGNIIVVAGMVMVIVGIGFKLALVPFHGWAPDVYQGSSAPVAAFLATCSKGSLFVLMLRYFSHIDIGSYTPLIGIFTLIAVASMFAGNLLALSQRSVKRLLAYSSISHFGYLLIAFLSTGPLRGLAAAYYLVAYCISILGAFGVITVLSGKVRDADAIEDFHGLSVQHPWLAGTFTAMLLSLAGIPLSAGFMGKFYVMSAGVGSNLWLLIIILVVNSAIGLFYYLKVIAVMYMLPPKREVSQPPSLLGTLVLAGLLILLLWLGVYPSPVTDMIRAITVAGTT